MSIPRLPTQAVILAAGLGSRLRPLTNHCPKPLVAVGGVPILHNALGALAEAGVKKTTIVVGYRKDAIRASCGHRFRGMDVAYVESSVFEHTGSASSLWLAREALSAAGDAVLLEGDVFFAPDLLQRLAACPTGDVAAVAPFTAAMEGTAVTLSPTGYVEGFRLKQTGGQFAREELFKTINLFRFTGATLRELLVPALGGLVAAGATRAYVEEVLAGLVGGGSLALAAVNCGDLKWYEVDSVEDLRSAEAMFLSGTLLPT